MTMNRLQNETLGFDLFLQIENHPQVVSITGSLTDCLEQRVRRIRLFDNGLQPRIFKVDNNPLRVSQQENLAFYHRGKIKNDSRPVTLVMNSERVDNGSLSQGFASHQGNQDHQTEDRKC